MALRKQADIYEDLLIVLTADGGSNGVLTVASTEGLFVKQKFMLFDLLGTERVQLEILEVLSDTQFVAGIAPTADKNYVSVKDCSMFLLANGASIRIIPERREIPESDHIPLAAYETSPVNAFRVHLVDGLGKTTSPATAISKLTPIAPLMDTVDFSFITSSNAATSNLILTTDSDRTMLILCNYTDVELGFAYDYSQGWDLAPGKEMVLDLGSNFLKMVTDKDISVFYTNTPPTTGTASVTII